MASTYRPRPAETKLCIHCGVSFETRHKRTVYCGSSCRVLAYNARHEVKTRSTSSKKTNDNLSFSLQNIGVVTTGAAAAAVGNYVFNDQPTKREILARLDVLEKGFEVGLNRMLQAAQYQVDYVNAMKHIEPELQGYINQVQQKNQLEVVRRQDKKQNTNELAAKLLAKRKGQ